VPPPRGSGVPYGMAWCERIIGGNNLLGIAFLGLRTTVARSVGRVIILDRVQTGVRHRIHDFPANLDHREVSQPIPDCGNDSIPVSGIANLWSKWVICARGKPSSKELGVTSLIPNAYHQSCVMPFNSIALGPLRSHGHQRA
jgi:hypothetical protein